MINKRIAIKTKLQIFVYAIALSALIVLICAAQFPDFFFFDDSQNIFLPFSREMGRIWLSGHLPILTTNTFLGGNFLVDLAMSPFSPQAIFISILSTQIESLTLLSYFNAWFNISLTLLGGYWLARAFEIKPLLSWVFAITIATQPLFLYLFSGSWWNFAYGYTSFIIAFAALIHFRRDSSPFHFVFAIISFCVLGTISAAQAQLLYFFAMMTLIVADFYNHKRSTIPYYLLIAFAGFFIAVIPIFSEYIINSDLINRASYYSNENNFSVPAMNAVFQTFNPTYQGFMHWYGGYKHIPVPLAFSTLFVLPALVFLDFKKFINDKEIVILIVLTLLVFILTQSPSQTGPIRYPFRFLPLLALFISLLTFKVLSDKLLLFSPTRNSVFWIMVAISSLLALFSTASGIFGRMHMSFVLYGFILMGSTYWIVKELALPSQSKLLSPLLLLTPIISLLLMIYMGTPTLAGTHLQYSKFLLDKPANAQNYTQGYTLGLIWDRPFKNDISDLSSGNFMLYGIPSINGYSPIGHKFFSQLFPYFSTQGYFYAKEALHEISKPAENLDHVYVWQLFNIQKIYVWKSDLASDLSKKLDNAGLQPQLSNNVNKMEIIPKHPIPNNGSLSYHTGTKKIIFLKHEGMRKEHYSVEAEDIPRKLIFSRIYWLGYHVTLNGKELEVSSYKNTLVAVDLPKGASGELILSYEPISFTFSSLSILFGLILMLLGLLSIKRGPTHK